MTAHAIDNAGAETASSPRFLTVAGGQFGFLDGDGQFVPTADVWLVTHYRVPDTAPETITLWTTVDDVPFAPEPQTALVVATWNDSARSSAPIALEAQ